MKRSSLAIAAAISLGCGTEPSGILTLTVEDLPQFVLTATVNVRGTVTRDPVSDTPVVVSIVGGSATVSDTIVGGQFSFTIRLKSNQENQLSVTAFDGTGSIAPGVVVSVFHDDTGPLIVSSIPANKDVNVSLTTAIEVRYGEPLVATTPSASFTLKQNSRPVLGTATLSVDKTLFTFQPTQQLEPASIYEMVVTGFIDEAGNPTGANACFITAIPMAGLQTAVTADSSTSTFSTMTPPEVVAFVNLLGATLARSGSTLYGLFEFEGERSLRDEVTRASVFVDIDLDNNPTTGFQAFKDLQFGADLSSGLGAEAIISLDAHVISDSGFVGVSIPSPTGLSWDVIDVFLPGVCGRFFGFHTTAILGDSILDDGNFDYVYHGLAVEDSTFGINAAWADPVPVSGSFPANLITPGPLTSRASPPPPNRVWPPQKREAPLIRLFRWLRGR